MDVSFSDKQFCLARLAWGLATSVGTAVSFVHPAPSRNVFKSAHLQVTPFSKCNNILASFSDFSNCLNCGEISTIINSGWRPPIQLFVACSAWWSIFISIVLRPFHLQDYNYRYMYIIECRWCSHCGLHYHRLGQCTVWNEEPLLCEQHLYISIWSSHGAKSSLRHWTGQSSD